VESTILYRNRQDVVETPPGGSEVGLGGSTVTEYPRTDGDPPFSWALKKSIAAGVQKVPDARRTARDPEERHTAEVRWPTRDERNAGDGPFSTTCWKGRDLRGRAKITSHFRIPSSGHLRLLLNRTTVNIDRLCLRSCSIVAAESDPNLGAKTPPSHHETMSHSPWEVILARPLRVRTPHKRSP